MSKKPRQVDNGPSQHMSAKECSLRAFCTSALLVFFNACLTSVRIILKASGEHPGQLGSSLSRRPCVGWPR